MRDAQCYATKEEAQRNCETSLCWTCVNGKVVRMTPAEAQAKDLKCYPTREEAQQNCKIKTCWTCVNGKVIQLSEAQARAKGLKCYESKEEAQQNCKSEEACWVSPESAKLSGSLVSRPALRTPSVTPRARKRSGTVSKNSAGAA